MPASSHKGPANYILFQLSLSLVIRMNRLFSLLVLGVHQKQVSVAAGCCGCLQKAILVPTGQAAMKSTPSSDKQQTGPSCCPPSKPFRSLPGSLAALTYPQVSLYRSEAEMPFVTASETPGQRSPRDMFHPHGVLVYQCTFQVTMQGQHP